MNSYFQRLLACAGLILALPQVVRSQTEPPAAAPTAPSASQSSSTAPTAPAAAAAPDKPAAAPTSATAPTSDENKAAMPAASATENSTATTAPASTASASTAVESKAAAESAAAPATESTGSTSNLRTLATGGEPESAPTPPAPKRRHRGSGGDNARVTILGNSHLDKNEVADAVVAIGGNSESEGDVSGPVVAVAGNARATGPVSDAVVAVLGNAYVDSRVGQVVAVMGNVELGPNAEVMHDVVCVGGELRRDPKAIVHGNVPHVGVGHFGSHVEWLQSYLTNCVLKGRPLAIAPHLAWAWFIALGFLGFYLLISLIFARTVERNCETLEQYPGASLVAAILTLLLTPVVIVLLCITVVGIAVVPFLAIGLMLASIFGRVVMLAWIGRRLLGLTGKTFHPVLAVLIGGIVMLALYLVPFFGFVVYKVTGVLGLGVVVYSIILANKREKAARAAAAAAAAASAVPPVTAVPVPPVTENPGVAYAAGAVPTMAGTPVATAPAATVPPPVVLSALPRAGFWIRLGAMLIDIILVGIVAGMFNDHTPRPLHSNGSDLFLVLLGIYTASMWKLKGTTIGGIVCGLRVVRIDGREIDWATAVVRTIAYYISAAIAFLGFIWVAFDDEKQSWHDKIAGTTVVHHRGSNSLV